MTHSLSPNSKLSETDLAFELLQVHGRPIHYCQLIEEVLSKLFVPIDARQVSAVLTQINLDTRFAYIGQGEWGLKVWVPSRGSRRLPTITLMNKSVAYDDEVEKEPLEDTVEDLDGIHRDVDDEAVDQEEFDEEAEETDEDSWE